MRAKREKKAASLKIIGYIKDIEKRKEIGRQWMAVKQVLDETLRLYIEREIEDSVRRSENKDIYKIPNYSEYLADQVGTRRTLREILQLLP